MEFSSALSSMKFPGMSVDISWRRHVWAVALVVTLPLLGGCGGDEHVWNQKQIVTIQTPTGEASGSSVTQVKALFGKQMSGNEVVYGVSGEATVVEVRPGRYLFALLGGSEERYYWAVAEKLEGKPRGEWLGIIPQMKDVAMLDPSRHGYPLLVTFDDLSEPKSIRKIAPDDLAATFGVGYSLKSITLEITQEEITNSILEKILPWWCEIRGNMLDGGNIVYYKNESLANKIGSNELRTGECY